MKHMLIQANEIGKENQEKANDMIKENRSLKRDLRTKTKALTTYEFMLQVSGRVTVPVGSTTIPNPEQFAGATAHVCKSCGKELLFCCSQLIFRSNYFQKIIPLYPIIHHPNSCFVLLRIAYKIQLLTFDF